MHDQKTGNKKQNLTREQQVIQIKTKMIKDRMARISKQVAELDAIDCDEIRQQVQEITNKQVQETILHMLNLVEKDIGEVG